ncbi:MAG TPA: hypothetical protein HA341_04770 [Halobacteria archaeon]|jgi:hypothetical protein|nr:hypothetical protein [Halobacteria archaeon]HIH78217.1 hypothetical protein [Halobacteria archaeon]
MSTKEEIIKECADIIEKIITDTSVPKNIRRVVGEVRSIILDRSKEVPMRATTAISMLEDISNDSNMPLPTRTKIWEIISLLETISVD